MPWGTALLSSPKRVGAYRASVAALMPARQLRAFRRRLCWTSRRVRGPGTGGSTRDASVVRQRLQGSRPGLANGSPAVDDERLSSDPGGQGRREEESGVCYVEGPR